MDHHCNVSTKFIQIWKEYYFPIWLKINHNDQFLFKIKIWIIWWRRLELICYNRWLDACSAVNELIFRLQAGLKIFIVFFATDLNWPLVSNCRVRVSCSWISTFEIILIWDLWIAMCFRWLIDQLALFSIIGTYRGITIRLFDSQSTVYYVA